MSTPPLDIQRSKLVKIMVIVLRLGNTCEFMVFWIISRNTCSKRFEREGKLTQGHWRITNLRSQMFLHVDRDLYPLQM
jgi:hypothetical protein